MASPMPDKSRLDALSSPFARAADLEPDQHPNLYNISAGLMFWRFVPVPTEPPPPPEYAHVPVPGVPADEASTKKLIMLTRWNAAWEAGPNRFGMFEEDEIPADLLWLGKHLDSDIRLVPEGKTYPYAAYAPLYHLLPVATLDKFKLPALKRGIWPAMGVAFDGAERGVPLDFKERLTQALAWHLWPHLDGRRPGSFSKDEPITMIANSLDFWLPYIDIVAQERMKALGRVAASDEDQAALAELGDHSDPHLKVERPLFGGDVWRGQEDAAEATKELVEVADEFGRLRAIIDAVKSHRVDDDFSDRWSWAKEDFERKLYKKRSRVKVTFVEIDDTIPVHGPDAEFDEDLLWQDLLALCDRKERRVVVCLRSGTT